MLVTNFNTLTYISNFKFHPSSFYLIPYQRDQKASFVKAKPDHFLFILIVMYLLKILEEKGWWLDKWWRLLIIHKVNESLNSSSAKKGRHRQAKYKRPRNPIRVVGRRNIAVFGPLSTGGVGYKNLKLKPFKSGRVGFRLVIEDTW